MLFSLCIFCFLCFAGATRWEAADSVEHTPPVSKFIGNLKSKVSSAKFGASRPAGNQQLSVDGETKPEPLTISAPTSHRLLRWPPMITAVPEASLPPEALHVDVTSAAVDAQFCQGQDRCRILLPLWIGEQESRGRMHLTQLVHLAFALNRTLVLPNVGKSRLGLCGKWSFEAYYDTGSLARQVKNIDGAGRVMLMDDFKTWLDMRPDAPHGQLLFFQENSTSEAQGARLASEDGLSLFVDEHILAAGDTRLKNAYCLKTKFRGLKLDGHCPLSLFLTPPDPLATGPPDIPSGDLFVDMLKRPEAAHIFPAQSLGMPGTQDPLTFEHQEHLSEPDVVVVHWDLRHLPFTSPETLPPLEYSQKLWQYARRLISPHGPFLAVHWRMETVEPSVLPDCAEALVDTVSTLLADPTLAEGIKTVWLATDVPWSGGDDGTLVRSPEQRSNTFRSFEKEHFEAIDIVKSAFAEDGPLEGWKLTGLGEEIQRLKATGHDEELELAYEDDTGMLWEDSGVWGIFDKMAAMRSTLFVSGARGCGRVRRVLSSFVWRSC